MAGVGSKLGSWLRCPVCQDTVRQPKTLQCFHSFCEECVKQLTKSSYTDKQGVNCPVCRAFSEDSMIKSNFLMNELLETHKGNQIGKANMCEMCLKTKSTCKCVQCKAFLCESCKIMHLRVGQGRGHTVIESDDSSDAAIDKLVFCEKHPDQTVILNCKECEEPLCIKCKVTKHEAHQTETVEDTLERILPELEGCCEKVKLLIADIKENQGELEARKTEVKDAFEKCRKDGEVQLQKIIDRATEDYNALVKELDIREEEEMDKIRLDRTKEYEGLLEWKNICDESAKGVTLMEQVQSGMGKRLRQLSELKTIGLSQTRLQLPKLIIAEESQGPLINVIGKLEYKPRGILPSHKSTRSRVQQKPFKEIFSSKLQLNTKINLKGRCTRIAFICGEIWAPVPDAKCIQVIDTNGSVLREIACQFQPYSVQEAPCGDIIVASNTGLRVILPDGTLQSTISTDSFCDLAFSDDKLYAINRSKQIIQAFYNSDGWEFESDIKGSKGAGQYNEEIILMNETGPIFTLVRTDKSQYYHCDSITGNRTVYMSQKQTFIFPYLCGFDSTGALLVADCENENFQIHDADGTWAVCSIDCIKHKCPFDFLHDATTDIVWVLTDSQCLHKLQLVNS